MLKDKKLGIAIIFMPCLMEIRCMGILLTFNTYGNFYSCVVWWPERCTKNGKGLLFRLSHGQEDHLPGCGVGSNPTIPTPQPCSVRVVESDSELTSQPCLFGWPYIRLCDWPIMHAGCEDEKQWEWVIYATLNILEEGWGRIEIYP